MWELEITAAQMLKPQLGSVICFICSVQLHDAIKGISYKHSHYLAFTTLQMLTFCKIVSLTVTGHLGVDCLQTVKLTPMQMKASWQGSLNLGDYLEDHFLNSTIR